MTTRVASLTLKATSYYQHDRRRAASSFLTRRACATACIAVSFAGEVEDLGAQAPTSTVVKHTNIGEAAGTKAGTGNYFGGSLKTSGSFIMSAVRDLWQDCFAW